MLTFLNRMAGRRRSFSYHLQWAWNCVSGSVGKRGNAIQIYCSAFNLGDYLSAVAIRKLLPEYRFVSLICNREEWVDAQGFLRALPAGVPLVVGGGGLLQRYFSPVWEDILVSARNHPLCIWGIGMCDSLVRESAIPPQFVRDVAQAASFCSWRDPATAEAAGVGAVGPCPSIWLVNQLRPGLAAEKEKRGSTPKPVLLHAIHNEMGRERNLAFVAAIRQWCSDRGWEYREETNVRRASWGHIPHRQILANYLAADLVVSSRLHGCIMAYALGRPFLALCHDQKIAQFLATIGAGQVAVPHDSPAPLVDRLNTGMPTGDMKPVADCVAEIERTAAEVRASLARRNGKDP